jgi:hypothetical protein
MAHMEGGGAASHEHGIRNEALAPDRRRDHPVPASGRVRGHTFILVNVGPESFPGTGLVPSGFKPLEAVDCAAEQSGGIAGGAGSGPVWAASLALAGLITMFS